MLYETRKYNKQLNILGHIVASSMLEAHRKKHVINEACVSVLEDEILQRLKDHPELDEGILGSILGGAAGFIFGPTIGKVIAGSLGITSGILYDLFTSRLVSTAIGSALAKYLSAGAK